MNKLPILELIAFDCYKVPDLNRAIAELAFRSYKPLVLPGITGLLPYPLEVVLIEEGISIDEQGNPVRSFLNKSVSVEEVHEQEDPEGDTYYIYVLNENTELPKDLKL